jgi:PKHD-type hydroxylase
MISKYFKSKQIINYIKPNIDYEELMKNDSDGFFYLNTYPHNNLIYYVDDVFSEDELELIKAIGDRIPSQQGTVGSSRIDTNIRDSIISWIGVNDVTRWIYEKLSEKVVSVNKNYYKYDLEKIENLQFTRYIGSTNGFYKTHLDYCCNDRPSNRKLSFVLQLSDPFEYEGGYLKIYFGDEPSVVDRKKGLLTFFPSNVLHECTPVTSGERYVIVGWVYGPPFK